MIEDESIHRLSCDDREVILIGTAHVSRESADLVGRVIEEEKPETVCIELCESRYQTLTQQSRWQDTDLIRVIREKKAFLLLSNLILAHLQKRIGLRLGIRPGEEIFRAIQAAEAVNAGIYLADRNIRVTLGRAWRLMGWWNKIKLMTQLVMSTGEMDSITEEEIERLKKMDALEGLLTELGESFPDMRRILIDERDLYLAHKIRTAPGRKIVGVVGAGHLPGILRHWGEDVDLAALEQVPPGSRLSVFIKWAVPVLVLALIFIGFQIAGAGAGTHMIRYWVVVNAVLAGLGAAAALAHPLTIAAAALSAPLTSLNPMVAAGWVAGLVEALLGKPKVRDFENLPGDITSLKGFWKNKISRILLVVVLTNLGSSLGTFVAIPLMLKVFA